MSPVGSGGWIGRSCRPKSRHLAYLLTCLPQGRPGHVCIGGIAADYVRAAREAASRGERDRAEDLAAHAVIEADAYGPATAREALARACA